MVLYFIFAILGTFILLFSLFGGGDHHIEFAHDAHDVHGDSGGDNDSPKVLSLRTIASFLLAFGIAGIVCVSFDKGLMAQLIWGFSSGLFTVGLVYLIMKLFYSQQGYSTFNISELIGADCVVTVGTTSSGIASVRVLTPDGAREYTCREIAGEKLERNDVVTIKSIKDNTIFASKVKISFVTQSSLNKTFSPREIHTKKTEVSKKIATINGEMLPKKPKVKKPSASKKFGPKLSDLPK